MSQDTRPSADAGWSDGDDAAAAAEYVYSAFISYSRRDEHAAQKLHRRIERYRLPKGIAPLHRPAAGRLGGRRSLRPAYLDTAENAVSPDIGMQLRRALDVSARLVVLASPHAARSEWVDAEIRHMIDTGRRDDVCVVLWGAEPKDAMPPALRSRQVGWADGRRSRLSRSEFIRLVAGLLDVEYEELWRRHVKRLVFSSVVWVLAGVALATVVATAARIGLADSPERQRADFMAWISEDVTTTARSIDPTFEPQDLDIEIQRTANLNGDDLLDFFVINRTPDFCGSGGCAAQVYVAEPDGAYTNVLDLWSQGNPSVRQSPDGKTLDVMSVNYTVDNQEVYSVYTWSNGGYQLDGLEFCGVVMLDYCTDPVIMEPVDGTEATAGSAELYDAPSNDAQRMRVTQGNCPCPVIGRVPGTPWILVDYWKGFAGFARLE